MFYSFWRSLFCFTIFLVLATGCSSTHLIRPAASEYHRTASYAIPQQTPTALKRALQPEVQKYSNQSGFRVLETGAESLDMRLALVRAAEKTIDLQYYAIHDDITSNLLLEAVLRAAKRGVRVRFLLDGIAMDEVGKNLAVLDNNKNIEIRVFNPMTTRDQTIFSKMLSYIADLPQATKRMHNKAMIADNQMAIIGGRNLGDEYFDSDPEVDFKDLDILAAGPITAKISDSFDKYWNSDNAFPLAALYRTDNNPEHIARIRENMNKQWIEALKKSNGRKILRSRLAERLKSRDIKLIWAPCDLAVDEPFKIKQSEENVESKPLIRMTALLRKAEHEFLLTSPYFVPQEDGVNYFASLVKRGMKVKILTNSLASTDVVIAHTGYKNYRADIVKAGVELYELKPNDGKRPKQRVFATSAPAYAALHTKVYVIDRKDVMIGSFNFDPRSINLNTEIALVIHSKEIAAQIIRMFNESTSPVSSYRILPDKKKYAIADGVVWVTQENGREVIYRYEPKAGAWRKLQAGLMSALPVEDQL